MGMTCMKVSCLDQRLVVTTAPRIASGGRNENEIAFSFCPLWEGFEKVAVFYRDKDHVYNSVIDADKKCIIPWEVLTDEGEFFFSVFGVNGDITRTSEILKYNVVKGAITEDTEPSDPTPDMYEQFLEQARANEALVRDAVEVVNEVRDNLDEAHQAATTAQEAALNAEKAAENTVKRSGDTMTGDLNINGGEAQTKVSMYRTVNGVQRQGQMYINYDGAMHLVGFNAGAEFNRLRLTDKNTSFSQPVDISSGGTNAKTAEGARENLGAAAKSHKHSKSDISDFPESLPASDVPAWAKAASKPTYTAAEVGAASAQHDHNRIITGGSSGDVTAGPEAYDASWIGWGWSGKYSDSDDTRIAMSMRLNKDTGRLQARIDSKAGTRYPYFYTSDDKPTPTDIGAINKAGDEMTGPLTVGNDIAVKGDGWRGMAFRSSGDKGRNTIMTGDNNQFVFDTYETGSRFADRYFLPKCTTGKTGDSWYEILTAKNPAAVKATAGITDPVLSSTNASDVMRTVHFNVGGALIQTGITDLISCNNNVVTSHTVIFPKAFSTACVVLVSLYNNNDSSSHASAVNAFAATYSKTGCEIRFTNTSGGARTLRASWIAIGM